MWHTLVFRRQQNQRSCFVLRCFGPEAVNNLKHRQRWLIVAAMLAIVGWLAKFGDLTTVAPLLRGGEVCIGHFFPVLRCTVEVILRIGMSLYVWHKFVPRMIKDSIHVVVNDWLLLGHSG